MIVVPFCSLVLSVIVAHTILGPIGWKIGTFISDIVYAGISGSFRVVFGAIFGLFMPRSSSPACTTCPTPLICS